MKHLITIASAALLCCSSAFGDWGPSPLKSLVEYSDCVVVAEFVSEDVRKIDGQRIDQEVTLYQYPTATNQNKIRAQFVGQVRLATWQEGGNVFKALPPLGATPHVLTEDGVQEAKAIPLFRCVAITSGLHGPPAPCHLSTEVIISSEHPFVHSSGIYCKFHGKSNKEVRLGSVYGAGLPPALVKHVTQIIENPDGMGAAEELAMAKAITNTVMSTLMESPDWAQNPKIGEYIVKMLDTVTTIAERQSRISDKIESKLTYRQVLVLLSAAVEATLRSIGSNTDAKSVLFSLLPELPWPAGVARVTGAEGIIGSKGQLLLPKPPSEKELAVDATFEGLQTEPRHERPNALEQKIGEPLWKSRLYGTIHRVAMQIDTIAEDGFMAWKPVEPARGQAVENFRHPAEEDIFEVM